MLGIIKDNAIAIQTIAALLSVLFTAVSIIVLFITWKAIHIQAEAARELTAVAREQTQAAVASADAAKVQTDALLKQMEQTTAPLLVVEPDDRQRLTGFKVVNRGQGMAFKAFYYLGPFEDKDKQPAITGLTPATLGPGNYAYINVPQNCNVFTIMYKGADRYFRWTVYTRSPMESQDHIVQ